MKREVSKDDEGATPLARVIRSRTRPISKPIELPDADGLEVVFWNPNDEEVAESAADATRYLKNDLRLDEFQATLAMESNLYKAEEERQLFSRIMRDAKDPESPIGDIEDLRELLTEDIRDYLKNHLAAFIDERDPHRRESDPEKIIRRIHDLKAAGGLSEYLTSCDSDSLKSIALSLAGQLQTPTSPSSLDTSSSNTPNDTVSESIHQTMTSP
jgi:hypothetical protein